MIDKTLHRLRRRLTLLAAALSGAVVLLLCFASFFIARTQYLKSREADFGAAVAGVEYEWSRRTALDFVWLSEAESAHGILLYLEDSGVPLAFSQTGEEKQMLAQAALREAEHIYGILPQQPPLSGQAGVRAAFTLREAGGLYRCMVWQMPAATGWRTLVALQSTAPDTAYLLRLGGGFGALCLASLALMAALCWLFTGRALAPAKQAYHEQEAFIAAASHELRTPLSVLQTGFGAIRANPAGTQHYLGLMEKETTRMGRLIDDLLLLAGRGIRWRLDKKALEPETLLLEFAEGMETVFAEKGVRMQVLLPPAALPEIEADPQRLRQILLVLADNALRHSPAGGTVVLAAESNGKHCLFSVQDEGPGVPDEAKEKIFTRFYRAGRAHDGKEHFGLGLAVARELARLHGGRLYVQNAQGGGARFVLSLPF